MANTKWVKIGGIWKNKNGKPGSYLAVTLKQDKETVLPSFTLTAGMFLNVSDPRKRANITSDQLSKIPDGLLADVSVAVEE